MKAHTHCRIFFLHACMHIIMAHSTESVTTIILISNNNGLPIRILRRTYGVKTNQTLVTEALVALVAIRDFRHNTIKFMYVFKLKNKISFMLFCHWKYEVMEEINKLYKLYNTPYNISQQFKIRRCQNNWNSEDIIMKCQQDIEPIQAENWIINPHKSEVVKKKNKSK